MPSIFSHSTDSSPRRERGYLQYVALLRGTSGEPDAAQLLAAGDRSDALAALQAVPVSRLDEAQRSGYAKLKSTLKSS